MSASPQKSSTPSPQALPEIGSLIDGYELVDVLGMGGMGAVYKARKGGLDYALKLMLQQDSKASARFEREAQSLAKVSNHPHIVTIHNYSKSSPWPYLVSELIEGINLRQWFEKQGPKLEASLKVCVEVASALEHIHSHGIWHRDLKPENILIRSADGQAFLTDFGLAKAKSDQSLTQSGEFLGTLNYVSPEQMTGVKEKMGPASDIWSLGVVLYQLATGQLPFQAPSSAELMPTILFQDPIPPNTVNPKLPRAFATIIDSALEKEPKRRYPSAADFAKDCQALLNGHAVLGSGSKFSSRINKALPRHRGLLVLIVALLTTIAALSFGLVIVLQKQSATTTKNQVNEEYDRLSKLPQFKAQTIEKLTIQSFEDLVFPSEESAPKALTAELKAWIELERQIQSLNTVEVFEGKKKSNYQSLRRRLNPLYFLRQGLPSPEESKTMLSSRWRKLLKLAKQENQSEETHRLLTHLANSDASERTFARLFLGLLEVKEQRWADAEQSFLTLHARPSPALKATARRYLRQIYRALLLDYLLTKSQKRQGLQRVLKQLKLFTANEADYYQDMRAVQSSLDQYFQSLQPNQFKAAKKSYMLLEQLCGQIPLARPIGTAAFHKSMADQAHKIDKKARALFHHYQRLKTEPQAKLPREYCRYVFQDTIRLNMQVIHRSSVESQKDAADHLLEASRADAFFNEVLLSQEVHQLEDNFQYFTKRIEERPYDPYPRYWRVFANTRPLFPEDKRERARRRKLVKEDTDFVVKSRFAAPVFKSSVLLIYCEYIMRIYEQILISKALPKSLRQELLDKLKLAKSFSIPELDKFYHLQCRVYQNDREDLDRRKAPRSVIKENTETLLALYQSYLEAINDRWRWSKPPSHKLPSQSKRLRITLRTYQIRVCQINRELCRLYRHDGQKDRALKRLLSYRSYALQDHDQSLDYLRELVYLKEWKRAKAFLKVMPNDGYGTKNQERFMKLKALLSQY